MKKFEMDWKIIFLFVFIVLAFLGAGYYIGKSNAEQSDCSTKSLEIGYMKLCNYTNALINLSISSNRLLVLYNPDLKIEDLKYVNCQENWESWK